LLRGVSSPREDLALEIQVERLRELLRWREYLRILSQLYQAGWDNEEVITHPARGETARRFHKLS
jgi:hypothetical protein